MSLKLQLAPQELEHASLRLFLNHKLPMIESQLLRLARKYGVQTVAKLDELARSGRIHEAEAFEDHFEFDHLEAGRNVSLDSLRELARVHLRSFAILVEGNSVKDACALIAQVAT